ncbi:40-kDa huntingtin-associated protein [Halyomorpha halys]|uniref:40-kDa huntingtin-associated protein n=1 Tax=Halyomorpha halys TaxID=286706 RepID=UPI0006D4D525|nr:factor VIII intron 22 protein-like [Halyomorpha halys]
MTDRSSSDLLTQYKAISNKLKKKFSRKTNVSEPNDQFAAQCEKSELPQYAALNWLTVAKNEASLGHTNEEAVALLKAGRLFLEAERKNIIGCDENLKGALTCFNQVEKLWGDENPLTGALCLEVGTAMEAIDPHRAVLYFEKAVLLMNHCPHLHLQALKKLSSAKVATGDFHGALTTFTAIVNVVNKITSSPFGVYKDILLRCEISRVLLILILQPTPQNIPLDLQKFIEKYTWIGEPDTVTVSWIGEELFFLLQSLVMACQCQDLEAVHDLENDLWRYFSNEQKGMLNSIIQIMENSEK